MIDGKYLYYTIYNIRVLQFTLCSYYTHTYWKTEIRNVFAIALIMLPIHAGWATRPYIFPFREIESIPQAKFKRKKETIVSELSSWNTRDIEIFKSIGLCSLQTGKTVWNVYHVWTLSVLLEHLQILIYLNSFRRGSKNLVKSIINIF